MSILAYQAGCMATISAEGEPGSNEGGDFGPIGFDELEVDEWSGDTALFLDPAPIKRFDFTWSPPVGIDSFRLWESASPGAPFVQVGGDIVGESISLEVPLHFRHDADYLLQTCVAGICEDAAGAAVAGHLEEAVGYFKASNTNVNDQFGYSMALSADGSTLAVGARFEDSSNGSQVDNSASNSGAVYVYTRDGVGSWSQQAYVKASNIGAGDQFGFSVALSEDGDTLAVGAWQEGSSATGINGNQANNAWPGAGAAYVFVRDGAGSWSQQAYVKASNTNDDDNFGWSVALNGDGSTLAVGARYEDSAATGVGGNQASNAAVNAGAVYVFLRAGVVWSQQDYIKAFNTGGSDQFGWSVALSGDGDTLAVGANGEDSNATGIDGNGGNNGVSSAGAVYTFTRNGVGAWAQEAYVKPSTTGLSDQFGYSVALSGDSDTLAVGTLREDSNATGIGGNQADNTAVDSGAVFVFARNGAWSQEAYIKASNTAASDLFGASVALNDDGNALAVGANWEDSNATGIGGSQLNNLAPQSGAAYLFMRNGAVWSQETYVKASNAAQGDEFGYCVALSGDGEVFAASAWAEDSISTGVGGPQADGALESGAVYIY